MTLVVAEVHDGQITFVADTKITFTADPRSPDDAEKKTRHVYENAQPKIVILREDLAVGYAGDDPDHALTVLSGLRNEPTERILDALAEVDGLSFLVGCTADDPQLWLVAYGTIEERTSVRRGWVGDGDIDTFLELLHRVPDSMDVPFKLMSSMQYLLNLARTSSVGGFLTQATSTPDGFLFVGDVSMIGVGEISLVCLPGLRPTAGALAYWIPQSGLVRLFPQEEPWEAQTYRASSIEEVVGQANDRFGQSLETVPLPPWFGLNTPVAT